MSSHEMKKLMMCEFCCKTFTSPILLPCGETMCEKDINGLFVKENEPHVIYCFFCNKEHRIPTFGFPSNKIVNNLLAHNVQNLDMGHTYEHARRVLDTLKTKLADMGRIRASPKKYIQSFVDQLIDEMAKKRDHAKVITDAIFQQMVHTLGEFKDNCEARFEEEGLKQIDECLVDEVRAAHDKLSDELENLVVDEKRWREICVEADKLEKRLEVDMDHAKKELFLNTRCRFLPKEVTLDTNVFGSLKMIVRCMPIFFTFRILFWIRCN